MSLTRSFLKAMGLEEEKINSIIEAHTETTDALKRQRDEAREMAENAEQISTQYEQLKTDYEKLRASGTDAAKVQAEFNAYRKQVETEKENSAKLNAVRAMLKNGGVARDEFVELLEGKINLDEIVIEDGKIKDEQQLLAPLKQSYAGCFSTETNAGTSKVNPPAGNGKMTREEFERKPLAEQMNFATENPAEYAALYAAK